MNKKNVISLVVLALLLTALWFYIYQDLSSSSQENQEEMATTTSSLEDNISISFEGDENAVIKTVDDNGVGFQEEQKKPEIIKPIPDLNREVVFLEEEGLFSEQEKQTMIDEINGIVQELKNDPTSFSNWLYLGLNRKIIGDYEGARDAWEYARLVNTDNFVVRGNLGDLYAYYLQDNEKAELNYVEALRLGPNQIYLYYKVAQFYIDFLNDVQRAKGIVQIGLNFNPKDPELQSLLNSL